VELRGNELIILASDGVGHVLNQETPLQIVATASSSSDVSEAISRAGDGHPGGTDALHFRV
jgi:hypothetical protein